MYFSKADLISLETGIVPVKQRIISLKNNILLLKPERVSIKQQTKPLINGVLPVQNKAKTRYKLL